MELFGVMGYPISHSLSPDMHNAAFRHEKRDAVYVPLKVKHDELEIALAGARALGFRGLNVTVPYKEEVIPYLDILSAEASLIKAVNTISIKDGKLTGHNTDCLGFVEALTTHLPDSLGGKRCLIIGAGGASRAVVMGLAIHKAALTIANRTLSKAEALAKDVAQVTTFAPQVCLLDTPEFAQIVKHSEIIINTTSLGMTPQQDLSPVPVDLLSPHHFVVDIIYNPLKTKLISDAEAKGCQTQSGLDMLINQGAQAWNIWFGESGPRDVMKAAVLAALIRQPDEAI